jgi:hypothetical protein
MTEQELRNLVRRVVAERLGSASQASGGHTLLPLHAPVVDLRTHASHAVFRVPAGSETGGPCVIEPHVSCDHCGYCKSLGH